VTVPDFEVEVVDDLEEEAEPHGVTADQVLRWATYVGAVSAAGIIAILVYDWWKKNALADRSGHGAAPETDPASDEMEPADETGGD
jgi:uncharacterized membrane protein YebE (DUF533 family)